MDFKLNPREERENGALRERLTHAAMVKRSSSLQVYCLSFYYDIEMVNVALEQKAQERNFQLAHAELRLYFLNIFIDM